MHVDNRMHFMQLLSEAGVGMLTGTRVDKITDDGISITDKQGKGGFIEAESVVLAVGFRANEKLSEALSGMIPEVYTIGDCVDPRKVINAVWEAFRAARLI